MVSLRWLAVAWARWGPILRANLAFVLCWLLACDSVTQAVIELEIEPGLLSQLERVEITPCDVAWQARGTVKTAQLQGERAETPPLSFGAVADGSRELRVIMRGYSRTGGAEPVYEQRLALHLKPDQVRSIAVALDPACMGHQCSCEPDPGQPWRARCAVGSCLGEDCTRRALASPCVRDDDCASGFCSNQLCCNERCDGACRACDVQPTQGACVDAVPQGAPDHCGGCGVSCSGDHVASRHCTAGTCDGVCEVGWGDCDGDRRINGCEVELAKSADHCGGCDRPACPYGVCRAGECVARALDITDGSELEAFTPFRMYGMQVFLQRECLVLGLGLNAELATGAAPHVRLGLYDTNPAVSQSWPGSLLVESPELTLDAAGAQQGASLFGGVERRVTQTPIREDGQYWLFFISDQTLYLHAQAGEQAWLQSGIEIGYAGLPGMPATASANAPLQSGLRKASALYVIAACP